jgi:hypothetical protein
MELVDSGFQLVLIHRFSLPFGLHGLLQRRHICLQLVILVIAQFGSGCGLLQIGYELSGGRRLAASRFHVSALPHSRKS